ncbi:MAG TPA: hypothetical protein PLQ44_02230 [Candidatus Paceibacterota bacterium]|nr:hypothetical protein [Candidatus Paceibacterota bacterium]
MNKKILKKYLIIIVPILVVVGVTFLIIGISSANSKKLFSTQTKINELIKEINILASASNERFQLIEEKQKNYEIGPALDLVVEEKNNNDKINQTAIALTEQLKQLTKLSSSLSNAESRDKIQKAVAYQIEAIGHLINYGSGVDTLLSELDRKYASQLNGDYYEIKRDLNQLIELIKKEIQSADEYSQKFTQTISEIN